MTKDQIQKVRDAVYHAMPSGKATGAVLSEALAILDAALSQPDAQPVSVGEINEAWKVFKVWFGNTDWTVADAANFRIIFGHGYQFGAARTASPPAPAQPVWVGLTDEDIVRCNAPDGIENGFMLNVPFSDLSFFAKEIEAALKEKNHG